MEYVRSERYIRNREERGPPPYVKWESMTDTATTLYEQETTGDDTLPKTKKDWDLQMAALRERLLTMCLGGIGPKNLRQCIGIDLQSRDGVVEENGSEVYEAVFKISVQTPCPGSAPYRSAVTSPESPSTPLNYVYRAGGKSEEDETERGNSWSLPAHRETRPRPEFRL